MVQQAGGYEFDDTFPDFIIRPRPLRAPLFYTCSIMQGGIERCLHSFFFDSDTVR